MMVHEKSGLGQLRTAGPTPDYYLAPSARPFPFKSESELIDEGVIDNLEPPWGKLDWPGWKMPSVPYPGGIPSLENEVYDIRRSMLDTVWNKASPWNLNYRKGNWGTLTPPTQDNLGSLGENPFTTTETVWTLVGIASATLSLIFLIRAIPREPEGFWKAVGIMGAVGSGVAVAGGAFKLFSR